MHVPGCIICRQSFRTSGGVVYAQAQMRCCWLTSYDEARSGLGLGSSTSVMRAVCRCHTVRAIICTRSSASVPCNPVHHPRATAVRVAIHTSSAVSDAHCSSPCFGRCCPVALFRFIWDHDYTNTYPFLSHTPALHVPTILGHALGPRQGSTTAGLLAISPPKRFTSRSSAPSQWRFGYPYPCDQCVSGGMICRCGVAAESAADSFWAPSLHPASFSGGFLPGRWRFRSLFVTLVWAPPRPDIIDRSIRVLVPLIAPPVFQFSRRSSHHWYTPADTSIYTHTRPVLLSTYELRTDCAPPAPSHRGRKHVPAWLHRAHVWAPHRVILLRSPQNLSKSPPSGFLSPRMARSVLHHSDQ